jgi:hypothetical protein
MTFKTFLLKLIFIKIIKIEIIYKNCIWQKQIGLDIAMIFSIKTHRGNLISLRELKK